MGRYYEGSIEGKFWFGSQPSDDGEFFGAMAIDPQFVEYYIPIDNIKEVHLGISKCKESLGIYLTLFNEAYDGSLDINTQWRKLDEKRQKELYQWFARLDMGMKMLKHFIKNPTTDCHFTAEF